MHHRSPVQLSHFHRRIKHRTDVVGVFPNDRSLERLGTAVVRQRAPSLLVEDAPIPDRDPSRHQSVVIGFILITAKTAPSGSDRTAKRPGGISVGGTNVADPASVALETEASVSSTPK